jgi:DNA-binding MarR family transcriptional regulator
MATTSKPRARGAPQFYKAESYQPDDSVAYLMRRVLDSVKVEVDRELEPQGLTHAQWVPLYKLFLGHASTAAELSVACMLDAGAMTRTLDRLEAKGLIRRIRSAEDRRVVNLELTDEGRAATSHIPPVLCKVLNAHLKGFSVEEWQLLKTLLHRMLDNALSVQAQRENNTDET